MLLERVRKTAWSDRGWTGRVVRTLGLPLEGLFRVAVTLRGHAYDRGWRRALLAPVPVVSVGNLTVGGTGKTPMTAWIVQALVAGGARPALVSRGYGQDEVDLHRRWNPEVPVVVAARRFEGASEAAAAGATVVVLDDGFQHRRLARDVDIVLVAAEQPFPGALLPRGMFREPVSALARADLVIITRKTASLDRAKTVRTRISNLRPNLLVAQAALVPGPWTDLEGTPQQPPSPNALAVASIASPETFQGLLERESGESPRMMAFPDHHEYNEADARRIQSRAAGGVVVTTEKDAVKLRAFAEVLGDVRVLPLRIHFEQGEGAVRQALSRLPQRIRGS